MNEKITQYKEELIYLEAWFKDYDSKVIQYQRHIRTRGTSDINIIDLDNLAFCNAERIKELKMLIQSEYLKMSE